MQGSEHIKFNLISVIKQEIQSHVDLTGLSDEDVRVMARKFLDRRISEERERGQ